MKWHRLILVILSLVIALTVSSEAHVTMRTKLTDSIFKPGDQIEIKWEVLVEHDPVDWDLYFSSDGGESWEPIEEGLPLYQFDYTWIAPDIDSRQMLVRIVQDNEVTEDYHEDTDTFSILSANTAVYAQVALPFSIEISPNPLQSDLLASINLKKAKLVSWEIFNANGQSVQANNLKFFNRGKHIISSNLMHLPNGLYYLTIHVDSRSKSLPFIISR